WGAWWIQNSYGTTYCALPFYTEPFVTFLGNSHDLWFSQMGDGKRKWKWREGSPELVIPDGQLCDAASPSWFIPKQGDGRVDIHDWGMEFTAAGLLMQSELLLISRDAKAVARYLPMLERCANFIETRRDPRNNLFLAGPAGNLLAPSFAGWKKPDGTYDKAYLAGLSITYIAALDRLIEVERLAGSDEKAKLYAERRDLARKGLPLLTTDEGYFLNSIDPDGTKHGVFGAARHGYFEASPNHDAICFRVADDAQAERIYAKIASIPGLRPHSFILPNHPSYDDMYEPLHGIWAYGTWVNGGHWSTCEARMVMAYYRLGKHEDARRSMQQLLTFARKFRMDNPLTKCGSDVYQPREPINLCYDTFGPAAALVRGLFEYLYRADGLTLLPHIPPGITRLEQHFPIRFGAKRLYLATVGSGAVTGVLVNGKPWAKFDAKSVSLPYAETPDEAAITIALGDAKAEPFAPRKPEAKLPPVARLDEKPLDPRRFPVIVKNQLPLRIGADSNGNNRFLGDIAQPQVYKKALSATEVAELAAGKRLKGEDVDLVGDWSFGDRKGNAFANRAAEELAAKVVGEVETTDSPHGKALRMAGKGYLEVPHHAKLDLTTGVTLAAWICPKALPVSGARILDKGTAGGSDGYMLDTHPHNSLRMIVERGTLSHDAKLKPDEWVHVAAAIDADGSQALYVDGKCVASHKRDAGPELTGLNDRLAKLRKFHERLGSAGLADSYEAAHARLAIEAANAFNERLRLLADGKLAPLPEPSAYAADKCYLATAARLCDGLAKTIASYKGSDDPHRKRVHQLWTQE
ncbi:MAG: hypothetical protein FJ290_26790, partial [Planctomycetes bacterium]|nr:hypothetical protein [Planctomycetota bacterium]